MKVAEGNVMWEVPVGFIRNELDRVEKIADRRVQSAIMDGRARKSGSRRVKPQEKWKLLIRDNHEGYISWQDYE